MHLVDTQGRGVQCNTERGEVVAGCECPLDCLIFGSGFEVDADFTRRLRLELQGCGGQTLTDTWRHGAQTFHGMPTRGFPNLYGMTGQQSGQSPSFQHMPDGQSRHIAYTVAAAKARGARTWEACAEANWVAVIV